MKSATHCARFTFMHFGNYDIDGIKKNTDLFRYLNTHFPNSSPSSNVSGRVLLSVSGSRSVDRLAVMAVIPYSRNGIGPQNIV